MDYSVAKNLYTNGCSLREVEQQIGFPRKKLSRLLKQEGILRSFHDGSSLEVKGEYEELIHYEIAHQYQQGKTMLELEADFGFSASKINRILFYHNVERTHTSRKYDFWEDAFATIDSEEKAYWLGFLYADGYISKDETTLEVGLSAVDKEHLKKLQSFLGTDAPISERDVLLDGKLFPSVRLQVCSKKMVFDLIQLGCENNKSLTLVFPSEEIVPPEMLHHFMRGYFDGDGSYFVRADGQPHFSVIGTETFVKEYDKILHALGVNQTKLKSEGKAFSLRHSGKHQVQKIVDFLYKDATIYLERKHSKILPSPGETSVMMSAE